MPLMQHVFSPNHAFRQTMPFAKIECRGSDETLHLRQQALKLIENFAASQREFETSRRP